jgi:hypothetical protein
MGKVIVLIDFNQHLISIFWSINFNFTKNFQNFVQKDENDNDILKWKESTKIRLMEWILGKEWTHCDNNF